jgi:hypothetical protein
MNQDNKYLKENILDNIEIEKFPVEFKDKEPFYKWSNSILLSHSRFVPIRIGLLNAIWLGIPLVHNSPIIKNIHSSLDKMFYFGNKIGEMCNVFEWFISNKSICYDSLDDIKQNILSKWSIDNNITKWSNVLEPPKLEQEQKQEQKQEPEKSEQIIIAFSDMWPGFNYTNNFIIDSLTNDSLTNVKGIEYNESAHPNLLIFGPYGNVWKSVDIPKVFFSCENWPLPEENIDLFLTSSRIEDDKHVHIPTWMTFIDWFSDSTTLHETEDNPIRIPLHFAMTPHPIPFNKREKFCGFVVSNPVCNFRNETFS